MPIASPPVTYKLERPGCSGIACGPYLSIRDPLNLEREFERGSTGAVCVRGIPTFTGYETIADRNVPLDTSAFSSEGWFDSGDCGFMDEDGYLFINGRSKEIINRGGEVISPFEIEEAILVVAKDRVKMTIAFSVEHDVLQEAIGVVIVPQPDVPCVSLAELQDLLKEQLHPSKWPFLIVYMDDLPKNQAGKPLRIKLAQRLELGMLNDSIPALKRHYEAVAPDKNVPLSTPIPCSHVTFDMDETRGVFSSIDGVNEALIRLEDDGGISAFVYAESEDISAESIKASAKKILPGYGVPSSIYIFREPLPKDSHGEHDFHAMEETIKSQNAMKMSARALLVRDIVSDLLNKDAALISGDSDFFLLGGNSLLLGRLSYAIRKETGASLKVSDLFTNSTINGLAAIIDKETSKFMAEASDRTDKEKEGGQAYDDLPLFGEAWQGGSGPGRSQTHPISLLVQAIPLLFFYPTKAAWNCKFVRLDARLVSESVSRDLYPRIFGLRYGLSRRQLLDACYGSRHSYHHRSSFLSDHLPYRSHRLQVDCHRQVQAWPVQNVRFSRAL